MNSGKCGNPIRVLTEYIGFLHEVDTWQGAFFASRGPEDAFHELNMKLMQSLAVESGAAHSESAVKSDGEKTVLDDAWQQMKALYGKTPYGGSDIRYRSYTSLLGEVATVYGTLKDNVIASYLSLCSMEPLSASARKEIAWWYLDNTTQGAHVDSVVLLAGTTVNALGKRFDFNELVVQLIGGGCSERETLQNEECWGYGVDEAIRELGFLKRRLLGIMPMTLNNRLTKEQESIIGKIANLRIKLAAIGQSREGDSGEELDLCEVQEAAKSIGKHLVTEPEDLAGLEAIEFKFPELAASILQDYQGANVNYKNQSYKYALIACGALLESLLREYLFRRQEDVKALLLDKAKRNQVLSNADRSVSSEDLGTWSLDGLIKATDILIHDAHPKHKEFFDMIKRGRNKIHRGTVEQIEAALGLTVVKFALDLLNEVPV